ncbi:hypothetical protein DORFOR_02193 [Dorea formicigenerans ATCC 27755]|uniref:Uncharacterized protein n=1 Tax=Dorea formicigenerans ATCC 27755 TaxID=411461 RepID=B0G7D8_9FIRM|nr:hypothetical protein DORFOR_02193 [Dorea formicigenerans ATCC 27755]
MDNGFAPTETECRLAEVRSRSIYRRKTGNEFGMDESLSVQMVREKIEIC